ncbi:tubulin nucleotide-binding domain-like protein [Lasiosphaeria miniovina]|uniref:Tubulin nucleotide-binding domain-like protein n=1 Tax=Lasiosphaeria miniovina TaxID=1954250 RepID=A0AA40AVU2_9PEZI|nr:tubulin nucleotide-binding domain-like protein [Lasiosphaeria miniovina]KAK0722891.1 tubulin nucleotide-binding domain-like protein [Lasiosphaeria miniovina]
MHEIITLQLGQPSNYLATHFWNTQESYFTYAEDQESHVDHDIHWRPGLSPDGTETFMPRTVIYDLKGGFGSLRKINALYEQENEPSSLSLWSGPTVVHRQEPIEQGAYQQSLDAGLAPPALTTSTVRYWSDFNRVFFHPRSIVQLNEYELNSSLMPFENWESGDVLFSSLDKEHDIIDRDLRPFAEEADQMQAIQIIATLDDAWGGFASRYMERLRDEYGKTALWTWGLQDSLQGVPRNKRLLRLANKAKSLTEMYKQATMIVPLALPQRLPRSVVLDPSSQWHTSALLASAVESIMLPSRLKDSAQRITLGGLAELLNPMGKQTVAGLQMSFAPPPPSPEEDSPQQQQQQHHSGPGRPATGLPDDISEGAHLDIHFTPSDQLDPYADRWQQQQNGHASGAQPRVFSQVVALRGYGDGSDADGDADMLDFDERDHRRRRQQSAYETATQLYHSPLSFPLLDSFPRIFRDAAAGSTGSDDDDALLPSGTHINVTSSLSTDASVSARLKLLRATVVRSIGVEDREALGNDLAEMADEYHEGWSSGSDEGEDD